MPLKFIPRVTATLALTGTTVGAAFAQDSVAAPPPKPSHEVAGWFKRLGGIFETVVDRPVHPILKGVASGGGMGAGVGYDAPIKLPWEIDVDAVYTIKQYWSVALVGGYHVRRFDGEVYGRQRDMTEINYYGIGNLNDEAARTNFRLKDRVAGAVGTFDVARWLTVSGRVERFWPDLATGKGRTVPSTEETFSDASAPGLLVQPAFTRGVGYAEFIALPGVGESLRQGTRLRVTYGAYRDNDFDRYSFHTTDVELQQKFAVPIRAHHRLTLHALASSSTPETGNEIPFYMMRTLGGKGSLRSVHEDILGSDGTTATLRGYKSYRFRDFDLLLMQAEYRLPIWGPVDGTLFYDTGKVGHELADIDFTNLHHDYGFSISLMKGSTAVMRLDAAFGGQQAIRLLFDLGKDIIP